MRTLGVTLVCFSVLMAADAIRIWRRELRDLPARDWPDGLRETFGASVVFGATGVIVLVGRLIDLPA